MKDEIDIRGTWAYSVVSDFYKKKKANRSGVPYMNHIDEGLFVLNHIGASMDAKKAYCLHPLVQNPPDLKANYKFLAESVASRGQLILAMEYRNIANQFLSHMDKHPGFEDYNKIKLSPLKDVNDMLIADKIQNRKDFWLNNLDHPRAERLDIYFKQWLRRLGILDKFAWYFWQLKSGEGLTYNYLSNKKLDEVRASDIPRGLTAEDVAIDSDKNQYCPKSEDGKHHMLAMSDNNTTAHWCTRCSYGYDTKGGMGPGEF